MPVALITGEGRLPALLYEHLGDGTLVCELEGHSSGLPDPIVFRLETLGSLIETLVERGVGQVCIAGGIRRPALDPARLDAATTPLVPRMMAALSAGDDAALRTLIEFFEEKGIEVCGAHTLLPGLLPQAGVLTTCEPADRDRSDAERAAAIQRHLAEADLGQACIVAAGQALAVEAVGGTNWMLESISGERRPEAPEGGILFKAPKAGQDRRVDLPVIGRDTVDKARAAGLSGIVIEAGGVMVLDAGAVIAALDEAGMFFWVREP